jgi:hypothetical protein
VLADRHTSSLDAGVLAENELRRAASAAGGVEVVPAAARSSNIENRVQMAWTFTAFGPLSPASAS